MSIIRIIKENSLGIPIGTQLHYTSFFDKPKTKFDNHWDVNTWDSKGFYCWIDINTGKPNILEQEKVYPSIKDSYVNVIVLNNLQFAIEGETYYKVISQENECKFHKLEFVDGKHFPAIQYKVYKDKVLNNTNSIHVPFISRFRTEQQAIEFSEKCKKQNELYK